MVCQMHAVQLIINVTKLCELMNFYWELDKVFLANFIHSFFYEMNYMN